MAPLPVVAVSGERHRTIRGGSAPTLLRGRNHRPRAACLTGARSGGPLDVIPRGERTRLDLAAEAIRDGTRWLDVSGTAAIYVDGTMEGIGPGDRVRVYGGLIRPDLPQNPGQFDRRAHYRTRRVLCMLRAGDPRCVEVVAEGPRSHPRRFLDDVRRGGAALLDEYLGESHSGLASAILLGARDRVDQSQRLAFQETGTVHLLAISGLHVGIVYGGVLLLARAFLLRPTKAVLLAAACCVAYAVLTDARPPAIRASLLFAIMSLAFVSGRRSIAPNALAAAGIFVLVLNPTDLFATGVQLSFLAVAGLIWAGRRWAGWDRPEDALEKLVVGNRRVVRLLRLVDPAETEAALRAVGDGLVLNDAAGARRIPCRFTDRVVVQYIPEHPVGGRADRRVWRVDIRRVVPCRGDSLRLDVRCGPRPDPRRRDLGRIRPGGTFLAAGTADLVALQFLRGNRTDAGISALPTGAEVGVWPCSGLVWVGLPGDRSSPDVLRAHLHCPLGRTWRGDRRRIADRRKRSFMTRGSFPPPLRAPIRLRNTSGHAESCTWTPSFSPTPTPTITTPYRGCSGGFSIETVCVGPTMFQNASGAVGFLQRALETHRVEVKTVRRGDLWRLGDCLFTVFHPGEKPVPDDDNANCLVVGIEYEGRRILLTGDIASSGIAEVVAQSPWDCDVFLVPHHGSKSGHSPALTAWAEPEIAVASNGSRGIHPEVAAHYAAIGSRLLSTSREGAVRLHLRRGSVGVDCHGGKTAVRGQRKRGRFARPTDTGTLYKMR